MTKIQAEIQNTEGLVEVTENNNKKFSGKTIDSILAGFLFLSSYRHLVISFRFATLSGTETFIHKILIEYLIYFGVSEIILTVMDLTLLITIVFLALNALSEFLEETLEMLIKIYYAAMRLVSQQKINK